MPSKPIKTKNLKQTVTFNATPHQLYEMLVDSRQHARFTGAAARISRTVGGRISAWDGYIDGTNKKLVKDKLIVQRWRNSDWPKGYYSEVVFRFSRKGSRTVLAFTHRGIPLFDYKDIRSGWKEYYWDLMKKQL